MWTNLPPWPYTFCAGTKSTRSRHEKSWAVTKFFMDSSLLYFHSGLKYLVPAQAIIIGFRTVLVPSQAIPSRPVPCFVPTWAVLCRYRPASSLLYFLSVSVPARNRHEKSWVDPSHAVLKNDTKKCGHSGKLLHISSSLNWKIMINSALIFQQCIKTMQTKTNQKPTITINK